MTYKSLSAVNLDALAQTPDTSYLLNTNFSYYDYFGPGAAQTSPTSGTPAGATFKIDHTTELAKYNLAASWRHADLASTLLRQTGVASATGTVDTFGLRGGFVRDLSRIDSISLQTRATTASYTNAPNQTPYIDVSPVVTWNHTLSRRTDLTSSVTFDWFKADDPANSQRLLWQILTGARTRLSPRLSLNASIGGTFVNAYQEGALGSGNLSATSFQLQPGATTAAFGNAGLTYLLTKTTTVSLTAARAFVPTVTGQLEDISSVGFTLDHRINRRSKFSLGTRFAETNIDGVVSDFFSTEVSYAYRLTRRWRTKLSYAFRERRDATGTARSNTVWFSLTRDFNVLGNPTAFSEAEKERARERKQESVGQVFPVLQ